MWGDLIAIGYDDEEPGMLWGALFGLIFFVPLIGWAVGGLFGALFGLVEKLGIDRTFVEEVRDMVQPGTSALFLIVDKVTPDKAIDALSKFGGRVLKSSLSEDAELQPPGRAPGRPVAAAARARRSRLILTDSPEAQLASPGKLARDMRVVIAGGHGKIALRLTRLLSARGDSVAGLIRNPDQADDVAAHGGEPVVFDLERDSVEALAVVLADASAAVFAAGAGPGSGAERKLTVDRDGAIKLLEAARAAAVPGYLIISSVGAEDPPDGDDVFSVYLRAKAAADAAVEASDREWTIVRPGRLTDDAGTGHVRIDPDPIRGEIPRDDVAAVVAALLHDPRAARRILYLNGGEDPIEQAVEARLAEPAGRAS